MSEPLLRIRNAHSPACGDPPIISSDDPDVYIGYFENADGEQWIFTFHRKTKQAELRGGDTGWNTLYQVENAEGPHLVLSREELEWLRACWRAATQET
jgi:hypothetical protein